jgi:hypothetical protein
LTGTSRERPGLREALAACRAGDTLVVTKLDRLARSLPDARDIVDELTRRQVRLQIGSSLHDPDDPVGRLLFNVLAMVAAWSMTTIRRPSGRRPPGKRGTRLVAQDPELERRDIEAVIVLHGLLRRRAVVVDRAARDIARERELGGVSVLEEQAVRSCYSGMSDQRPELGRNPGPETSSSWTRDSRRSIRARSPL